VLDRKNMLWESNRIILPEHREALLKQRKDATRFKPPEIDEQQWQEMAYIIQEAVANEQPIVVTYAGEYEELAFCGYVDRVDPQNKQLHLSNGNQTKKIPFIKLLAVDWP
jgi:hypothetical protein